MIRKLYLTIGLSGSGKSFYYKNRFLSEFTEVANYLNENGLTLDSIKVCPDNIRKEICANIGDHSKEPIVWRIVEKRLRDSLKEHGYVLFDAINVTTSGRKLLKNFRGVHKVAMVFEPNVDLSKERVSRDINEGVDRSNVPMSVIERQFESFKKSVIKDLHWDGVWNESAKKKITEALRLEFNEIKFV